MSRNQWIVVALLVSAVAFVLGSLAGYLLVRLTVGFPPQAPGPTHAATQPSTDTPTAMATSTPTSAPPATTPQPSTPTSTSVMPVATYTLLPAPTLVPPEAVEPDDWEPDDTLADASSIEVGDIQSHNLHADGDHDWLRLEADEGATYVIETSNLGGGIDTIIYLYDEGGNELLSDDDGGDEFWASRLQWRATEMGRLYVMIRDLGDNDAGPRASYDVSLSLGEAFETDRYEPDDSLAEASRIRVGETQSHNLHAAGDQDWTYFEAVGGGTYLIETSNLGSGVDTIIYVYDEGGNELAADDDKGGEFLASRLEWTAESDGALYVVVRDIWGTSVGPGTEYDVSVSRM